MSGGRSWTTGEARKLHEMRQRRVPVTRIAAELGRSYDAVYSFLRYIPAGKGNPPSMGRVAPMPPKQVARRDNDWTPEETALLVELAEDGATAKDVADAILRTVSAVLCKASNLSVRFGNRGKHSICRLEQEERRFKRDAVKGSAMLLNAMLRLAA